MRTEIENQRLEADRCVRGRMKKVSSKRQLVGKIEGFL